MARRRLQLPLDGAFTPVSPSNLEPLTSRFQQVSLVELSFINEHLKHNSHNFHDGISEPGTPLGGPLSGQSFGAAAGTLASSSSSGPGEGADSYFLFDEEDDIRAEIRADAERPFPVDRAVFKDLILQHMHSSVVRMQFLSSGTFHKAFLVHLEDGREIVARIARRFMPKLKTESEVATINYLRNYTPIPVPFIYHWDANPYNRLGHEYILMSKAPGVPLHRVFHRLPEETLSALLRNLAILTVHLFAHRFSHVGSLYQREIKGKGKVGTGYSGLPPQMRTVPVSTPSSVPMGSTVSSPSSPTVPLPLANQDSTVHPKISRPFSHGHHRTSLSHSTPSPTTNHPPASPLDPPSPPLEFLIGSTVSWPFFGDGRGELDSPSEIDRGPWATELAYLSACKKREVDGVRREMAGTERGHRPHLVPKDRLKMALAATAAASSVGGTPGARRGGDRSRSRSRTGTYVYSVKGIPTPLSPSHTQSFPATVNSTQQPRQQSHLPWLPYLSNTAAAAGRLGSPAAVPARLVGDDQDPDADDDDSLSSSSSSSEDSSESDDESYYRDYRANLRSSLLVAQHSTRLRAVEDDMDRFIQYMSAELASVDEYLSRPEFGNGGSKGGQFAIHAHDLSLANIFVDAEDPSKITCIIDWESSTVRPLWHCAHLPVFLQPPPPHAHAHTHPHISSDYRVELGDLFRAEIARVGGVTGQVWLAAERLGARARDAHRFLEWDGWEEGLLDTVLASLVPPMTTGSPTVSASSSSDRTLASPDEHPIQDTAAQNAPAVTGTGGTFKMKNGFIGLSLT